MQQQKRHEIVDNLKIYKKIVNQIVVDVAQLDESNHPTHHGTHSKIIDDHQQNNYQLPSTRKDTKRQKRSLFQFL